MAKRSGAQRPSRWDDFSAVQLADWIDGHLGLLRGLAELRELGPQAEDAVLAVLEIREVRRAHLSWQLWEALVAGDGYDPDELLLRHLPYSRLELAQLALRG